MICCSTECTKHPCCDFCKYTEHEEFDEPIANGKTIHITGGPIRCALHNDARHNDLAQSLGACNDFHCYRAKKPNKWIEVDLYDS